jgi:hypothetical protein
MFRANDEEDSTDFGPERSRGLSTSKWLLLVLGSFFVACIVVLVVTFFFRRGERIPELTRESLQAAQQRWRQNGPKNYDLDVVLSGSQSGQIHVEVRNGEITGMTRNGMTPKQRRTWDYWTVPGQFDTIGQEMEMANDPAHGFPAPPGSKVLQKAQFDTGDGHPVRYHRVVLGTQLEIRWEVTLRAGAAKR